MSQTGGKKKRPNKQKRPTDKGKTNIDKAGAAGANAFNIPVVKAPAWQSGAAALLLAAILFLLLSGLEALKEMATLPAVP